MARLPGSGRSTAAIAFAVMTLACAEEVSVHRDATVSLTPAMTETPLTAPATPSVDDRYTPMGCDGRPIPRRSEPRPGRPNIRMGCGPIWGRLPPESIRSVVKQRGAGVQRCFDEAPLVDRALLGFVIGRDGSVDTDDIRISLAPRPDGARPQADDAAAARLSACLHPVVAALRFPKPSGGPVRVSYPVIAASRR